MVVLCKLLGCLRRTLFKTTSNSQTPIGTRAMTSSSMIEIERKFVIPQGLEERLRNSGACFIDEKTFHDVYYDSKDYRLTLRDHWLRQRDNAWHLKLPPTIREQDKKTAQYVEITTTAEILSRITDVLDIPTMVRNGDLAKVVSENCHAFANFITHRRSYEFDNCRIDLDSTDFDFCVGEVEVIVNAQDEVTSALAKVDSIATKLGFVSEKRIPGKLDAYLKKTNMELYQLLVQAKIFGDEYHV